MKASHEHLEAFVLGLKRKNLNKKQILDVLQGIRETFSKSEDEDDVVLDIMDRVWGNCHPDRRFFKDSEQGVCKETGILN